MALNARTLNQETLDEDQLIFLDSGSGSETNVEQEVIIYGTGLIISIEQSMEFRNYGDAGLIVSIEQTLKDYSTTAQSIITIEQTVYNAALSTFYSRNGWYPTIVVDGWQIPDSQLTGECRYTHNESSSALFDFSIIPPLGAQNIFNYQGKTVTCDVRVAAGTFRIFTGKIDIPELDVMAERITFRCSDNREERITAGGYGAVSHIGSYSTTVFGDIVDTKQEVLDRLTTIPQSLDWDGYGTAYLTDYTPKSTADYTLTDADVYRTQPTIRIESRAQLTNSVTINLKYNYQRFHKGLLSYSWSTGITDFLTLGNQLIRRDMIQSAASGSGWKLNGAITFSDIAPAGWYNGVAWSGISTTGIASPTTDVNGNEILDSSGKTVMSVTTTSTTDLKPLFCSAASWGSTKQWAQNISEEYTLTVKAPQSISRYGTVAKTVSATFTDVDKSEGLEDDHSYGITNGGFLDQDVTESEFNNASLVLINQAKSTILSAHRDSRVTFDKFLWPQIDLRHTVALSTTRIACKGKVSTINHIFDIETGEAVTKIEVALFRATGSQSESTFSVPTRVTDSMTTGFSSGGYLGNHYGEDPSQAGAVKWTGAIANRYDGTPPYDYPVSFVVDAPDVPDLYRQTRVLTASQTYNVSIPADNLVWTTVGH